MLCKLNGLIFRNFLLSYVLLSGMARLVILDEFKGEHALPLSLCDFVERVRGRPYASPRRARASLMYVIHARSCMYVYVCLCTRVYARTVCPVYQESVRGIREW